MGDWTEVYAGFAVTATTSIPDETMVKRPFTAKANPCVRSIAVLMQTAEDRLSIPHNERSFE
jgi:hypothetical protein